MLTNEWLKMTIHDLILYAHDRLEKEWYQTPKCDQMQQAFEHINEEISNVIMDCIIQAYNESGVNNGEKHNEHTC